MRRPLFHGLLLGAALAGALAGASVVRSQPPDDPETRARRFLQQDPQLQGVELVLHSIGSGLGATHVRFRQAYGGVPLFDRYLSVLIPRQGPLLKTADQSLPGLRPVTTKATITASQATGIARGTVAPAATMHQAVEPVYYPKGAVYRLAWEVTLVVEDPPGDWLVFVDAEKGSILDRRNRIKEDTGSGMVFNPNPVVTSGDTSLQDNSNADSPLLTGQRIPVTLSGLDAGSTTLKGQYADLTSPQLGGYKAAGQATEASRVYNYTRSDDRFEEVMAYAHVDAAQRYIQSLGFTNILTFAISAHAHYSYLDNAWYYPSLDAIAFGDGGVDDGEDADVVLHEYGHAIHDNQVPGWGVSHESGSMGEGFGDYWAATRHADVTSTVAAACFAAWDATSYSGTDPPCLRRLDNTKHYPEDMSWSSVHADGMIWGGALWDLRAVLGGTTTDRLVLESHFYVNPNASFADGANAILQADQNLYGGAHTGAIRQVFVSRGILANLPYRLFLPRICLGATDCP